MDDKVIKSALVSCGLEFLENECYDYGYDTMIESWKGKKKITIYCGNPSLLLRVWGPNIHNEMSEHILNELDDLSDHIDWLIT